MTVNEEVDTVLFVLDGTESVETGVEVMIVETVMVPLADGEDVVGAGPVPEVVRAEGRVME